MWRIAMNLALEFLLLLAKRLTLLFLRQTPSPWGGIKDILTNVLLVCKLLQGKIFCGPEMGSIKFTFLPRLRHKFVTFIP